MASAPVIHLPDMTKPFVLVTDASDVGTGAMLAQKQAGGQLAPVAFSHHSLSRAEQNYTVTDREMLAVVLAVKKFRVYLSSQPFVLVTDHAALKWLNSLAMDEVRGRRARWIEYLQQFQMNPIHRPGTSPELSMADYLSRVKQTGMQKVMHCLAVLVMESKDDGAQRLSTLFTVEEVRQAQEECPAVGPVLAALKRNCSDSTTDMSKESQEIMQRKSRLVVGADGLLRYKEAKGRSTSSKPLGKKTIQVVVLPRALRRSFLELVHSKPLSGHMGRNRTTDRIRDIVWWPWMSDDISTYVKGCDACQRHKRTKNPESARLQKTEVPKSPLSQIQIDFMGPFQPSVPEKFRYVLAIQDVLTRYAMLIPTADCTASTAASMLLTRWVTVLDIPEVIQSDQGSHFTGQVFRKLCEAMGMEQRLSSPNHPQSNGQVERQNQLMDNIRCVCDNNPAGWADAVVAVQYAHNTSSNATTGYSPHQLLFHQAPNRPERFAMPQPPEGRLPREIQEMERVFTQVRKRIDKAQEERRNRTGRTDSAGFAVGDSVRFKLQPGQRTLGKLHAYKSAIYEVVSCSRNNSYRIKPHVGPGLILQRHFNELERAPHQVLRWENTPPSPPSGFSSDDEGVPPSVPARNGTGQLRRSTRRRRPTTYLQVDPSKGQYSSQSAESACSDNESSDR